MAGSSFTGPLKIKKSDGTKVTFVDANGNLSAGVDLIDLVDVNGNEILEFDAVASAVNHIGIVNAATTANPQIRANGEADTGITFANKDGEEILILDSIATSVNELTIKSAATGNNPVIAATGEADTGITFENDQSEEILILDANPTAVNEITIDNAATGAAPVIAATGDDTNLSLTLTAKGTGVIQTTEPLVEEMTQTALTDTATVTAAQLMTKILDGTPTAAATYTLPTAALLVGGIANAQVGDSFLFFINNKSSGANTITVAAGSGGTADGTLTVAQNVIRAFLVTITNVTSSSEAYFVYGLGA